MVQSAKADAVMVAVAQGSTTVNRNVFGESTVFAIDEVP